jgi:CHASE3 domain sensor protein
MSDDQTRLLTEIRDIAREHMELYRTRSASAIGTQRRAFRAWVFIVTILVVSLALLVFGFIRLMNEASKPAEPPGAQQFNR